MRARRALAQQLAAGALALPAFVHAQTGGPAPPGDVPSVARPDDGALRALLAEADAALAAAQPARALELLQPHVDRYAGVPSFDYRLGIAALDAGRPGLAILALERVLAVQPDHLQARAEIARAYLAAGERANARQEFETVSRQAIPPDVARVIDRYLSAIARLEATAREPGQRVVAWAETSIGWDDNPNFGSAAGQWLLFDGTAVTPLAVSRPRSSAAGSVGGGLSAAFPLGGGWEGTVGGAMTHKFYASAHTLDLDTAELSAGLNRKADCHAMSLLAQYQNLRLDDLRFRNAGGVLAQWRCDVSRRHQVGVFLQGFDLRYPDQSIRDARRTSAGLTYAQVLDAPREAVLVANVYGGDERTRANVPSLDHRFLGARVALNMPLAERWFGWGSASWESRDFGGEEVLFGVTRRDRMREFRLGADRALDAHWTVSPQLVYTRNASTLAPNDFRRTQALVSLRYTH